MFQCSAAPPQLIEESKTRSGNPHHQLKISQQNISNNQVLSRSLLSLLSPLELFTFLPLLFVWCLSFVVTYPASFAILYNPAIAMAPDHKACLSTSRRPDYLLAACYMLLYLELGWLILMLIRSYSRD